MMKMLTDSIMNLNSKFDQFNETVTGKICRIENNYERLSYKIDSLATERCSVVHTNRCE